MFKALATAATFGVLCWPIMSFASPDYNERAPITDSIASTQPKPLLGTVAKPADYTKPAPDVVALIQTKPPLRAVPATSRPTYNGYYGPMNGLTNRPAPLFLGLGGRW
jgi:hypothetical protein